MLLVMVLWVLNVAHPISRLWLSVEVEWLLGQLVASTMLAFVGGCTLMMRHI
jgi:hypothetical protein